MVNNKILISTDLLSRGFDNLNVDLIIYHDFAKDVLSLLHRIGRTGRIGRKGKVINFIR